ncbi:TPA: thiamine phosphate synthase [Candidatus Sumerlaeota bacterium]|nr:thiamine phosphate synthase [Candidatus Sumerlaeota bacterium]
MTILHHTNSICFTNSGLYLISDEEMIARGTFLPFLESALAVGLRLIQLRVKHLSEVELKALGREVRRLTRAHKALFILNDRPELAVELDADGVHVGQDDLSPTEARKIIGTERILGLSTHNREQILAAQNEPVDYIGVGPVFPTTTKLNASPVTGLELLTWAAEHSRLPQVAIGGISFENIDQVLTTGCKNAAVISAISRTENPVVQLQKFQEKFTDARREHGV